MFSKKLLCLIVVVSILFSLSFVSASELNSTDNLQNEIQEGDIGSLNEESNQINLDKAEIISSQESEPQLELNVHSVYVGENITSDGGNGSKENPYNNLELVQSNYGESPDKIEINLYNGTYFIGPGLTFNTSDLSINSVNGNVILKNLKNEANIKQAFILTNVGANFTMSNIIFDCSDYTQSFSKNQYFLPYNGAGYSNIIYNNCTFTGFNYNPATYLTEFNDNGNNDPLYDNILFNSCKFVNFTGRYLYKFKSSNLTFRYCLFLVRFTTNGVSPNGIAVGSNENSVIFDSNWFGQNNITFDYFYRYNYDGTVKERYTNFDSYLFTKYAEFHIYENYLGNNKYEIIGKLMWNDSTTDNIDKLGSMIVKLSSETGNLTETAILENGTFKVIYNGTSSNHKITAKLDSQEINLTFTNIDMSLNSPTIAIGNNQNITATFNQAVNGTIIVTVNEKDYLENLKDLSSITVAITEPLSPATYDVIVSFVDEDNHIHALNTTTITISKSQEYDFNATITPNTLYIGDNATVTLSLPEGATGNVTIKVGENEAKTFNINEVIVINGFVAGDNEVNITFISDMYDTKSIVKNVFASTKPTTITTVNVTTTYNVAKELVITLTDVNGKVLANKTINVVVGTINANLTTNDSGQASVDVSTLAPNTYPASIAFAGDEVYAKSNTTATVVVNKIASSIKASKVTATYNVAKKLIITLTANGKPLKGQKVTVKVGTISKTLTTDANGQVSVDVSKLTPKTYTATFTYAGDSINDKSSNTAKVVVNKAKPKLTAKKATFKAKKKTKKYSIVLKDNKGKAIKKAKVTLKVKGKTYKATTNNKGKATFKITKLTKKGKTTATIKFGGNTFYKAVTKKAKLTIKK